VQGTLLAAAISPDNTPHGYNLTFAFPMLMFIIIATLLYVRFRSPHRAPGQAALASTRQPGPAHQHTTPGSTLHEGTPQVEAGAGAGVGDVVGGEGSVVEGSAQESEDGE
jgi:hypothetical protein